jgi:hypothetical protein
MDRSIALAIFFVALGAFGFFAFQYVGTKIKGMKNTGVDPAAGRSNAPQPDNRPKPKAPAPEEKL